jgi:glutamate/tyrosine decarboxylase-like PLP-dependent enzyme
MTSSFLITPQLVDGLMKALGPDRAHLISGLSEADSWATDGHKWLNVPYDCGLAFVRERESLPAAMSITAAYLAREYRREPADYTPESSPQGAGHRSLGRFALVGTRRSGRLG